MNLNALDNLAEAYLYTGEPAKSVEECKKIVEIDPTYANAHIHLSTAYRMLGQYDLWLDEWMKQVAGNNDAAGIALVKANQEAYAKGGYQGALRRDVEQIVELSKHTYVDPALVAAAITRCSGKRDQAFAWLEKGYAQKSVFITYIKVAAGVEFAAIG